MASGCFVLQREALTVFEYEMGICMLSAYWLDNTLKCCCLPNTSVVSAADLCKAIT